MKSKFTYLIILMLNAALSGCADKGHEIYVSPTGIDSANGELSTPVASLQRAAALAREKTRKVPAHHEGSVINNIMYNIDASPLRFHKAFQNIVRNNVFVCGEDVPPIHYVKTKEEDIEKVANIILDQSSETDLKRLKEIVKERAADIGPMTKTERKFKIITYNIWIGYQDGESERLPLYHSGEKRKEEIFKWLKEQNPDVVFFQELIDYTGDKLMAESRFWGHQYAVTLRDKGMAVGFSSKYPIEVKEILTEGMHHGLIYCSISGIDVIGTHLWPRFDDKILDEVKIIGKRVNESLKKRVPVIVLGDFNAFSPEDDPYIDSTTIKLYRDWWKWKLENGRPSYRVIQELLGLGLKDVCVKFDKNSVARKQRYDFIFASPGLAEKCTDAIHYQDGKFLKLSDHFPVTASFEIDK